MNTSRTIRQIISNGLASIFPPLVSPACILPTYKNLSRLAQGEPSLTPTKKVPGPRPAEKKQPGVVVDRPPGKGQGATKVSTKF